MKISLLKNPEMILVENKAKARIGLPLKEIVPKKIKALKDRNVVGVVSLLQMGGDEEIRDEFFDQDMPLVTEFGEYEVNDVFVRISQEGKMRYAEISVDRINILFIIDGEAPKKEKVELPDCEVLVGEPEVLQHVQFAVNPVYVVFTGQNGLDEYKTKTGISEIETIKKLKVRLKPGQDLSGQSVEVYHLE